MIVQYEKSSEERARPQMAIYLKLTESLRKMESELGLSPAARTRISANIDDGSNKKPTANRWSGMAGA
jgi:phage terminase small subunit